MKRSTKLGLIGGGLVLLIVALGSLQSSSILTTTFVASAEKLIGLTFNEAKRDSMMDGLDEQVMNYVNLRKVDLPNDVVPSIGFNPLPVGMRLEKVRKPFKSSPAGKVTLPADLDELAFYSVGQLAELIKTRRVTSTQLTQMYIRRLKKYDPQLLCVVTLTEELAMRQAKRADEEIARGKYRGPLHGIPYGVKDLLATRGIRTTWGSVPFKDQIIDVDATVVQRLDSAGAILVAKLSMGELAWGDVWFGGTTKNPWNLSEGSSGSSAGPASATSAGLVGFSIGTETWGSIVSPATRCGVTGLRPTYGRVSRSGAMALSWSMDKIGPICRTVEDCALVFNAIQGLDGKDQSLIDVPFNYNPNIDLKKLRIGYLKNDFDSVKSGKANNDSSLAMLERMGAKLIPIELPKYPIADLGIILTAEAGAAFDQLTRSGQDDLLVRQIKDAWPNVFRQSRFIPAVEYIQANRVRTLVINEMATLMNGINLYIAPTFRGNNLLLTNLTGHPCVVVPNGFTEKGMPTSICFMGKLFDEATILAVAKKYQDATGFHLEHPRLGQ